MPPENCSHSLSTALIRAIYDGIMVREGLVIDSALAEERARNIAMAILGLLDARP